MLTFLQAIILGSLQGVTELFPISSLGHSVLIAYLLNWHGIISQESADESTFLSFLVLTHVATAIALIIFYRQQWLRIIRGFFQSVRRRKIDTPDGKLAWLLIAATIPAGLTGLIFEHSLRGQFAKPFSAMCFLIINGFILLAGDYYIKHRSAGRRRRVKGDTTASSLTFGRAIVIGVSQIAALFAGISRSGVTMLGGLLSGLDHDDAARFSFLLATPIILLAGLYKLPDFLGANGNGARPQDIIGALCAGVAAYFAVRYLDKYFKDRDLRPFGIYCIVAGVMVLLVGIYRGHF